MRSTTAIEISALCFAIALHADAVCDQTAASQADRDLWQTHGCWTQFYTWEANAYDLQPGDWKSRGWTTPCDPTLEYPKHWNAAYLLTYGLLDSGDPFHTTSDYRATAEASASNFHDSIRATIDDGTTLFGSYSSGVVTTYCPLYDLGSLNANPGSRGGDFMHEGWHAWLDKNNFDNGPMAGHRPPQGKCDAPGCDYFYFHAIGAYAPGELYKHDNGRFHSPNQIQVEYLCDIFDQSKSWVPESVKLAAQSDANARSTSRFINGPGYACGDPRPF